MKDEDSPVKRARSNPFSNPVKPGLISNYGAVFNKPPVATSKIGRAFCLGKHHRGKLKAWSACHPASNREKQSH